MENLLLITMFASLGSLLGGSIISFGEAHPLGSNRYLMVAEGAGINSSEKVEKKFMERAHKRCGEPPIETELNTRPYSYKSPGNGPYFFTHNAFRTVGIFRCSVSNEQEFGDELQGQYEFPGRLELATHVFDMQIRKCWEKRFYTSTRQIAFRKSTFTDVAFFEVRMIYNGGVSPPPFVSITILEKSQSKSLISVTENRFARKNNLRSEISLWSRGNFSCAKNDQ